MKTDWKSCLRVGTAAFLLFLAVRYWDTLFGLALAALDAGSALLMGCVIAYVINIPMSLYEKHWFPGSTGGWQAKSRRGVCLVAALLSLAAVVALLVVLVLPELSACIEVLVAEIPVFVRETALRVEESGLLSHEQIEQLVGPLQEMNWQEQLSNLAQILLAGVGGAAQAAMDTLSAVGGLVIDVVISLIFALYLLACKERLHSQASRLMGRYLPEKWDKLARHVFGVLDDSFHRFIVGQCTEAVVLGVLCITGMSLLGFPYAVMIGALVGFTALIPVAGAYIGAAVGAFMILTVDPLKAAAFLLFIVVLQQLEGNLIYPRVVGSSIGLPGVWVLATVTVAGGLLGVGGMLIGVPLAAAAYRLLEEDVRRVPAASDPKEE